MQAEGPSSRAPADRLVASMVQGIRDYAIFALDADGGVRTWNDGAERLHGFAREAIVGQPWSTFFVEADRAAGLPDRTLAITSAQESFEDEGWRCRSDGSRFWANVVTTTIRGEDGRLEGFAAVVRDLTERKRGEDALRESEERFSLLVSSVADYAIFLLNPDGTIASWNLGAERLKGYRADEIIGRHFSSFYTDEDRRTQLPARALHDALDTGRWESEGWRVRKDGTRFWADVVITALWGRDGRHRGFAKVTRDLTERKRSEDALRGVLDRERATAERLRELDRMKTDLVAIVAHDLRAPVGVLRSVLDALTDEWATSTDELRLELVERARKRTDALAEFVDDVFDVARIEAGQLELEETEVDLEAVIGRVVADLAVSSPERKITVQIDPEAVACGDEVRCWQILSNLVTNAVKFSPDDSTIEVAVLAAGDSVVTTVTDHGIGIPDEDRHRLFQRFNRLRNAAGTPGSGMGLFIARSLAEAQGGQLELVRSSPEGSTFSLTLPAAPR